MSVVAACANIALVKYWGKREPKLNLPARGSLSLTLDALKTFTEVAPTPGLEADTLEIDGVAKSGRALARVVEFLDLVRAQAPASTRGLRAHVRSRTTFPVAAGLASSASGFAALAGAARDAYGLDLDDVALSGLARQGSGSAARSVFGGFVRMDAGRALDGHDAVARPVEGATIELGAAICVVDAGEKEVGSTDGMDATRETSPYHRAWLDQVDVDLHQAEQALRAGDLATLTQVVEGSCLAMHANALAARPGIVYWQPTTLWAIAQVRALQRRGVPVMFTIDAGPHVVAFAPPSALDTVAAALGGHPEVARVIVSRAGPGLQRLAALPVGEGTGA